MTPPFSFRSFLSNRADLTTLVALALITLLAGVARIAPLPNEPLWLDELHTSWTVVDGLADVAPRARLGNQSPLYFYLPWLTTHALGPSEFTLRLPSLVAGLTLVPLVFAAAAWFSHSRLAGIAAALLVSLDQDCIFYAQEARPYALVQMLAVINGLCFWRLLGAPSLAIRAAWILTGALLFYTHYTAALILVAEGVYFGGLTVFTWVRGAPRTAVSKSFQVAFDATVMVMLCLSSLPHLVEIFGRRQNWQQFISAPDWTELGESLPFVPLVGLPLLAGIGAVLIQKYRGDSGRPADVSPRALVYVACWFALPVAVVTLSTWLDWAPLFHRRYIIGALPAIIIFATAIAGLFRNHAVRVAYLVLIVGASVAFNEPVVALAQTGEWPASRNQNWKAAIEFIAATAEKTEKVYVYSGLLETKGYAENADPLKQDYCRLPARGLYQLPQGLRLKLASHPLSSYDLGSVVILPWIMGYREPELVSWYLTTTPFDADLTDEKYAETGDAFDMSFQVDRHYFGDVVIFRVAAKPKSGSRMPESVPSPTTPGQL